MGKSGVAPSRKRRYDKYRPEYEQTINLDEEDEEGEWSSNEDEEEEEQQEELVCLQPGGQDGSDLVNKTVLEANPLFSSKLILCFAPLTCVYSCYLIWSLLVLSNNPLDEEVVACGAGEMYYIICSATVIALGTLCFRLCNAQAAHDIAIFLATGRFGVIMRVRNTAEAIHGMISAFICFIILVWSCAHYSQINHGCIQHIEERTGFYLVDCFLVTTWAQVCYIWYWFMVLLFTKVRALRRMVGGPAGRVSVALPKDIEVRMKELHGKEKDDSM